MGLVSAETMELIGRKNAALTERDWEFAARFALRTDDRELTEKLIGELLDGSGDRDAVYRKYRALTGPARAGMAGKAENLLVSLEMYRALGERAVKELDGLLSAYGISMPRDEARGTVSPGVGTGPERDRPVSRGGI